MSLFEYSHPTSETIKVSGSAHTSLKQILSNHINSGRIVYTTEFPYSRKRQLSDGVPRWRYDRKKFPKYDLTWEQQSSAFVVQDKKTGTIYYWFVKNSLSDTEPTEREQRIIHEKIMPGAKANEENLPYIILGWDWGFYRKNWEGEGHFMKPGDQYAKFFDEPNVLYYFSEAVYSSDIDKNDVDTMKEDYKEAHENFWKPQNYTDENLGRYGEI